MVAGFGGGGGGSSGGEQDRLDKIFGRTGIGGLGCTVRQTPWEDGRGSLAGARAFS